MRRLFLVLVALLVAAVVAWRLWPGEERRIRTRLDALAAGLSIAPGEAGLARLTRAAGVRSFFTEDVAVEVADDPGLTIRGREEIAGYVARLTVPPEGTRVELIEVDTQVDADRRSADVRATTRIVVRGTTDPPSILDARTIGLTLRKVEGEWLIANARVMPTDDSLGIR
jgi:hypothetical protein